MKQITPLGLQTDAHIEQLYQSLYLLRDHAYGDLELDCSFISFVRPTALLALVNTGRLWNKWTNTSVVLTNIPSNVFKYLERIDVFKTCNPWLVTRQQLAVGEQHNRSQRSRTLLEVLPIAGNEPQLTIDVEQACERAEYILRCWFPGHNDAIIPLRQVLSEIASNIVHSQDQGFAVIQRYDGVHRLSAVSQVVISITDLGIGIRQSLAQKGQHPTRKDRSALLASDYIQHAFNMGITSRDTIAGVGLPRVLQIVQDWRGLLAIRSFRSFVKFEDGGIETCDDLVEIPGTQVTIAVRDP